MRFLADLTGQRPAQVAADPSAALARGLGALGSQLSQMAADAASGDPEREERAREQSAQLSSLLARHRDEAPPNEAVAEAAKRRLQGRLNKTLGEAVRRLEALRDDIAAPDADGRLGRGDRG